MQAWPPVPKELLSLDRPNWDFDNVTERELVECLGYEQGRESPPVRERIRRFRDFAHADTFEELLAIAHSERGKKSGYLPLWGGIAPYCPEFPERPFLKILFEERKRRIELYDSPEKAAIYRAKDFQIDIQWLLAEFTPRNIENGVIPMERHTFSIAAFAIDWGLSNTELGKELENWARVNRKLLTRASVRKMRGAGSSLRQLKTRLKLLGGLRLLRAHHDDWEKALDYSEDHRASRTPLYKDKSAWYRVRRMESGG